MEWDGGGHEGIVCFVDIIQRLAGDGNQRKVSVGSKRRASKGLNLQKVSQMKW